MRLVPGGVCECNPCLKFASSEVVRNATTAIGCESIYTNKL